MKIKWENIGTEYTDLRCYTWRAKVFGGWLIKSLDETRNEEIHPSKYRPPEVVKVENISIVFIPDPKHVWDTVSKLLYQE